MRSLINRFINYPFHSILLAIYPVINLFAYNVKEVSSSALFRPLLISLGISAVLLVLISLVLRDWQRAGLLISLTMLLFFTYGHIYDLKKIIAPLTDLIRHRFLIPVYLTTFIVGIFFVLRSNKNPQLTQVLNLVCVLLLVYPSIQITVNSFTTSQGDHQAAQFVMPVRNLTPTPGKPLPSVYVILVDGYMRSDALKRDLGYDNSDFIKKLEDMGFYVAHCSRPNYTATVSSLITTLNMDYLDPLKAEIDKNHLNMGVTALVKHSKVRQSLEAIGYRTVVFDSGYEWSRMTDADVFLGPNRDTITMQSINPFEAMLIKSTAMRIYTDNAIRQSQVGLAQANSPYHEHIELERYILAGLTAVANDPSPKFVFAHILIPHWPYVFLPDGSIRDDPAFNTDERTNKQTIQGYSDSVGFLDNHMPAILQQIIANSPTPPVIVLFGDHGLEGNNRSQNLSAIYLPGEINDLYPTITPVNYFRVIFNDIFNAGYDLAPDISYKKVQVDGKVENVIFPETAPECIP